MCKAASGECCVGGIGKRNERILTATVEVAISKEGVETVSQGHDAIAAIAYNALGDFHFACIGGGDTLRSTAVQVATVNLHTITSIKLQYSTRAITFVSMSQSEVSKGDVVRVSKTNHIRIARPNNECSPLSTLYHEVLTLVEHQLIAIEHTFSIHLLAGFCPCRQVAHVGFLCVIVKFHHVREVDNAANGYNSVGT